MPPVDRSHPSDPLIDPLRRRREPSRSDTVHGRDRRQPSFPCGKELGLQRGGEVKVVLCGDRQPSFLSAVEEPRGGREGERGEVSVLLCDGREPARDGRRQSAVCCRGNRWERASRPSRHRRWALLRRPSPGLTSRTAGLSLTPPSAGPCQTAAFSQR